MKVHYQSNNEDDNCKDKDEHPQENAPEDLPSFRTVAPTTAIEILTASHGYTLKDAQKRITSVSSTNWPQ